MKKKYPKLEKKHLKLMRPRKRSQVIKELDAIVRQMVFKKDNYTCVRCGKKYQQREDGKTPDNLSCSHFWVRNYMGTRFVLDNLDTLCKYPCHFQKWEKSKQGEYRDYMIKKLGKKGYEKLKIKAQAVNKFSTNDLELLLLDFKNVQ